MTVDSRINVAVRLERDEHQRLLDIARLLGKRMGQLAREALDFWLAARMEEDRDLAEAVRALEAFRRSHPTAEAPSRPRARAKPGPKPGRASRSHSVLEPASNLSPAPASPAPIAPANPRDVGAGRDRAGRRPPSPDMGHRFGTTGVCRCGTSISEHRDDPVRCKSWAKSQSGAVNLDWLALLLVGALAAWAAMYAKAEHDAREIRFESLEYKVMNLESRVAWLWDVNEHPEYRDQNADPRSISMWPHGTMRILCGSGRPDCSAPCPEAGPLCCDDWGDER